MHSLDDLNPRAEFVELERKLTQSQHGKGEVRKDFWPSYSVMANAREENVLLRVREKNGVLGET